VTFERREGRRAGLIGLRSASGAVASCGGRVLSQQVQSQELTAFHNARLWRDQGKVQQARELLAPVYGWFTEGFDTLDLREAKALLQELAA
jgi:predicted ATPase